MKELTEQEVIDLLRKEIGSGTIKAWAKQNDFSEQYVGDVLHGRRSPAYEICEAIGVKRSICYELIEPERTFGQEVYFGEVY